MALIYPSSSVLASEYSWERNDYDESSDSFMNQFDEFGNFVGEQNLLDSDLSKESSVEEDSIYKETGKL